MRQTRFTETELMGLPTEGEVVLFGCNKKTEEEIYNFVIDYVNNVENTEKQKLLIEEFKK